MFNYQTSFFSADIADMCSWFSTISFKAPNIFRLLVGLVVYVKVICYYKLLFLIFRQISIMKNLFYHGLLTMAKSLNSFYCGSMAKVNGTKLSWTTFFVSLTQMNFELSMLWEELSQKSFCVSYKPHVKLRVKKYQDSVMKN